MSNHLGLLRSPKGTTKISKRIGRGQGSGKGGTSTKGHKGHQSRSGFSQIPNFEGGQMAYIRRVPKFGFFSPFRVEYQVVNVQHLQKLHDAGHIQDGIISPEVLHALGVVSKKKVPVKILGSGDIKVKLNVSANKVSASAKTKIESAGGTVTVIE